MLGIFERLTARLDEANMRSYLKGAYWGTQRAIKELERARTDAAKLKIGDSQGIQDALDALREAHEKVALLLGDEQPLDTR